MVDINMKIHPSFYDDECAIVFSFSFIRDTQKIGSATIYTCEETGSSPGRPAEWLYEEENDPREKIAYVRECSIHDEYYEQSMEKISGFLKVIGINKCIDDQVFQKQLVN